MLKFSTSIIWRLGTRSVLRNYSAPAVTATSNDKIDASKSLNSQNLSANENDTENKGTAPGLVAAAFASLNSPDEPVRKPSPKSIKQSRSQQVDMQISKASDLNSLLIAAEGSVVSRRHALKMVSILSDWSSTNKVNLSDFEKDPRFLKLCRILARAQSAHTISSLTMAEDLSTVLGITGDDEAARLISNLTLPQMIKVMKALNQKGRRSTPLLRALSYNITKQPEVIDLKKSADLLYSMASLNFPDPVLLDRICHDVIESLPSNDRPAVVNSIVVSLGLLKYRHEPVLSSIAEWLPRHLSSCRATDVSSAVMTFATLSFVPSHVETLFETAQAIKEEELTKSACWLDLVFSLLCLGKAQEHHILSILQPEFIEKLLASGEIPIPARRKLMMIDAYAQLTIKDSPRLAEDIAIGVPVVYTKEKTLFIQSIMDTFKSLVSADNFLRRNCNSGMGFLYDAEFAIDAKCHPVQLEKAANNKNVFRIAVLGLDYHDMTRKTFVPLGVTQLYSKLLELKGYNVLQIPYTEFNPKDKLVARVQYIERRLKEIVSSKAASP